MVEKFLDNLFSISIGLTVGVIFTVLTFSITSLPYTPEEVKKHFIEITSERLEELETLHFRMFMWIDIFFRRLILDRTKLSFF